MERVRQTLGKRPAVRLQRRTMLRVSATTATGIMGIILTKTPPLRARERVLKLLTISSFVPAADEELERQLNTFGRQAGIKVRMDRVAHLQLAAILASEVQGQSGHDLAMMWNATPHLYAKHLVPLSEMVEQIGRRAGGWTNPLIGRGSDGQYHGLPWYFVSWPLAVRTDLIAALGENLPDTWDDVHRIGSKLKKQGHPLGLALSHAGESLNVLRGIVWSWGGKVVEADGKTVAFNTKETVEAYKFVKALYQDCMEAEVLGWDDRNNNVCLNSGKCSMILNPAAHYFSARKDRVLIPGTTRPIHQVINHLIPPQGPAGRRMMASHALLGLWKWSPVQEAAKAFLAYHFEPAQQDAYLRASRGFNQPLLRTFAMHPIYASDPKLYFYPYMGWYTHAPGWPGPPTPASQAVIHKFILADTMAACATGQMTAEAAVEKATKQITRIYRRYA